MSIGSNGASTISFERGMGVLTPISLGHPERGVKLSEVNVDLALLLEDLQGDELLVAVTRPRLIADWYRYTLWCLEKMASSNPGSQDEIRENQRLLIAIGKLIK